MTAALLTALLTALLVVALTLGSSIGFGASPAFASGGMPASPTTTVPDDTPTTTRPPLIDNDFLPQDANLSDCVGFVERPGCGSEARGGLQMTLIFLALATGLAIIFWRVSVGVKRNRARLESAPPHVDRHVDQHVDREGEHS